MDEALKKLELEVEADPQNKEKLRKLIQHYERIGWTYNDRTIQEWLESLDSKDRHEFQKAAKSLGELGPRAFQAIEKLIHHAQQHRSQYARLAAIEALSKIDDSWEKSRPVLLKALNEPSPEVQATAAFALKVTNQNLLDVWDQKCSEELQNALSSEDWQIRLFAIRQLSIHLHEEPSLIEPILMRFEDPERDIQEAIIRAVETILFDQILFIPELIALFQRTENSAIKLGILEALDRLASPSKERLSFLIGALQDEPCSRVKAKIVRSFQRFEEFTHIYRSVIEEALESVEIDPVLYDALLDCLQAIESN